MGAQWEAVLFPGMRCPILALLPVNEARDPFLGGSRA